MGTRIEQFSDWMRRQGYAVIQTASSHWVEYGPRTYQAIPFHRMIRPSEDEIMDLLRQEKAVALRYSTPLDAKEGSLSYHVVYESNHYSQQDIHKKARHDVTKGLSVAAVEPISLARLADEGWAVRLDTLKRQGRTGAETRDWWEKLCLSAQGLPNFEAWGALVQGRLVAALLAFVYEDNFSILYQQSLTEYLHYGVNNALTYAVTSEVVERPGSIQLFYGLQSLNARDSVDKYKFRMGYIARPVRQRVVFNPWIAPFVNNFTYAGVKALNKIFPGSSFNSKTGGMLNLYLNGRRPLAEQDWPEVLLDQKEAILAQLRVKKVAGDPSVRQNSAAYFQH
jgi:hypothetical protein